MNFREDELGAVQISLSSWSRTQWRSLFISNLHCVVSFHLYLSAGSLPFCPPTHPVINYTAHSGSFCTNNCCCTLIWHSIEFVLAVKEVYEICYYRYIQKENTSCCCSWKSSNNKLFFFGHMSKIFPLIEIIAVPLLSVGNAAYRFSTNDLWQFCIIRKKPQRTQWSHMKKRLVTVWKK